VKFKLDENFGARTQRLFQEAGHEVETVRDEGLQGASDSTLYEACRSEHRCLVSLDVDFADVFRFPPKPPPAGIVVVRPGRNASLTLLESLVKQALGAIERMHVDGQLWVVETGRIRIHQAEEGE